jgi:hypothetical protein
MKIPAFVSLRTKCFWLTTGLMVISRAAIAFATGGIPRNSSPDEWVFDSIALHHSWWSDCLRILYVIGEVAFVAAIASLILDFATRNRRNIVGTSQNNRVS